MTKDKFTVLCEQVLVPRLGDLMHRELTELHQGLDVVTRELIRIGERLDKIAHEDDSSDSKYVD